MINLIQLMNKLNMRGAIKLAALGLSLALFCSTSPAIALSMPVLSAVGTQHQIEGALDQAAGRVQRTTGDVKGQMKGLTQEAAGKAKRDIGRVESKAESVINSGQDALSDTGEQLQAEADDIVSSIKDLVD